MDAKEFKDRTMKFGLSVIDLVESVPSRLVSDVLSRQLVRSATSVGANYRAACRAKSPADFIYKVELVEEEIDESAYWLEVIARKSISKSPSLAPLRREADELTALVVASIRTAKRSRPR
jgi:four helix bundle protein